MFFTINTKSASSFFLSQASFHNLIFVVDGVAFASKDQRLIDEFKAKLASESRVKLRGMLTNSIGWELTYSSAHIYVSQSEHVGKLCGDHNLKHVHPIIATISHSADISLDIPIKLSMSIENFYRFRFFVAPL